MVEPIDWKVAQTASDEFVEKHATKTGHTIRLWNLLQDTMGNIFAEIALPSNHDMAYAIWYSQENDRAQRKMLKAAALVEFGDKSKIYKELKWICDRADSLAEDRNNVVHVSYSSNLDSTGQFIEYAPSSRRGHSRAEQMKDKDVFAKLDTVQKHCQDLFGYLIHLAPIIAFPDQQQTWPERPSLPKSPQTQSPRTLIRQRPT